MSLIHNEQTKLTATWLNTAGTASIAVGVIAPLAAAIFGYPVAPGSLRNLLIGVSFWLSVGIVLHFLARLILRRLRP